MFENKMRFFRIVLILPILSLNMMYGSCFSFDGPCCHLSENEHCCRSDSDNSSEHCGCIYRASEFKIHLFQDKTSFFYTFFLITTVNHTIPDYQSFSVFQIRNSVAACRIFIVNCSLLI